MASNINLPVESFKLNPFVEYRKSIDIFRRNDYNLDRMHLVSIYHGTYNIHQYFYKNTKLLSTMISDSGKILHRRETGFSAKTQRHLSRAVRRARQMGGF